MCVCVCVSSAHCGVLFVQLWMCVCVCVRVCVQKGSTGCDGLRFCIYHVYVCVRMCSEGQYWV